MEEQTTSRSSTQLYILVGVIVLALIAGGVFIAMTNSSGTVTGAKFDYSQIPSSRTEDGGFLLGDPEAPVTIVEFADFQCSHCQEYTEVTEMVISELVMTGKANFEYRMFPTVDRAAFTSRLVECAAQEDAAAFWPAHDVMFDLNKQGWQQTSARDFARAVGVDYNELVNCIEDAGQWRTDVEVGQSVGVNGTPAIRLRVDGELRAIAPEYERGGPGYSVIALAVESLQE